MSNELSIYAGLIFNKNGASVIANESASVDISGNDVVSDTQNIGTSAETISLPSDVSGVGYLLVKNLDDSNYITLGPTAEDDLVRVDAGEFAFFRIAVLPVYVRADTAAVKIQKTFIKA